MKYITFCFGGDDGDGSGLISPFLGFGDGGTGGAGLTIRLDCIGTTGIHLEFLSSVFDDGGTGGAGNNSP